MNGEMSAFGTKRTWPSALHMSAIRGKADMTLVTMSADPKWAGDRPRPEPPPVFTGS